ncbi:hypothetical protein [Lactococcus lactis]|uniref:hypothetical protein n=1 Tax=Lactococcus lactis TaxID=1358 RepID=UPI0024A9DE0C|nr:hypothetical protein [Lactococcus lactis]
MSDKSGIYWRYFEDFTAYLHIIKVELEGKEISSLSYLEKVGLFTLFQRIAYFLGLQLNEITKALIGPLEQGGLFYKNQSTLTLIRVLYRRKIFSKDFQYGTFGDIQDRLAAPDTITKVKYLDFSIEDLKVKYIKAFEDIDDELVQLRLKTSKETFLDDLNILNTENIKEKL